MPDPDPYRDSKLDGDYARDDTREGFGGEYAREGSVDDIGEQQAEERNIGKASE